MKKLGFLSFAMALLINMFLCVPGSAQTRRVCYYTCKTVKVKKAPVKGCNSCARLLVVEQQIAVLMARKVEGNQYPGDHEVLLKLQSEFDGLVKRVEKLESDMTQAKSDITELRTGLNSTDTRVDELGINVTNVTTRVTTLEKKCGVVAAQDQKGKWVLIDTCTDQRIKTGGGVGTGTKVAIGTGIGLTLLCVFGVAGLCRSKGGGGLNGGITGGNW